MNIAAFILALAGSALSMFQPVISFPSTDGALSVIDMLTTGRVDEFFIMGCFAGFVALLGALSGISTIRRTGGVGGLKFCGIFYVIVIGLALFNTGTEEGLFMGVVFSWPKTFLVWAGCYIAAAVCASIDQSTEHAEMVYTSPAPISRPKPAEAAKTFEPVLGMETPALIKKAKIFMSDGDFDEAERYLEQALRQDPENSGAYLAKLAAQLRLNNFDELGSVRVPLGEITLFQRALEFANDEERAELQGYLDAQAANLEAGSESEYEAEEITDPTPESEQPQKNVMLKVGVICLILAVIAGGAFWFMRSRQPETVPTPEPQQVQAPEPEPEPLPDDEINDPVSDEFDELAQDFASKENLPERILKAGDIYIIRSYGLTFKAIKGNGAVMYSLPDAGSAQVMLLPDGSKLIAEAEYTSGTLGDWYFVNYGASKGWVQSRYITDREPDDDTAEPPAEPQRLPRTGLTAASVTSNRVNVRSDPTMKGESLFKLDRKTNGEDTRIIVEDPPEVNSVGDKWYRVRYVKRGGVYEEVEGYIIARYVKVEAMSESDWVLIGR